MTKSVEDRFIADEPASHGKVTLPNGLDYWAGARILRLRGRNRQHPSACA